MERCELCDQRATMHCESDRASLCWSCDEKVHGANFLVAKHARALLCHVCQSPTPWRASGQKLGPTVSVCEGCLRSHEEKEVVACGRRGEVGRGCIDGDCCSQSGERHDEEDVEVLDSVDEDDDREEDDDDDDEDTVDDEVEDEEEDEEEEEDGENQVVPWTFDSPPPVASSSSADEDESVSKTFDLGGGGLRTKRLRQSEDLNSDDEIGCVSSGVSSRILLANEDAATSASFRPTKQRRRVVECERNRSETRRECSGEESNSHNIVNTLKRLHRSVPSDGVAAADDTIAGICRLSGYEGR